MTRNEFIAQRIKAEGKAYRITVPLLIVCVVAAVVLSVVGLVMGKGAMSLGPALIMISIALQIPSMIKLRDACTVAEQEFDAYLKDPSAPLSATTENLIDRFESRGAKELQQQFIAYLAMGIMLLGLGIFLFVILRVVDSDFNLLLNVILPGLMAAGGVFLCLLAFKAGRDLKTARALESMESEQ